NALTAEPTCGHNSRSAQACGNGHPAVETSAPPADQSTFVPGSAHTRHAWPKLGSPAERTTDTFPG
ncbi:MAG TPA: hypothetical protein VF477_10000, partial [Mycobacterium sp.]